MTVPSLNNTLTTTAFYILLAVADRPTHGYGIRHQIAKDSGGDLVVPVGTLYPALKRLTREGYLEPFTATLHDGTTKLHYRITPKGVWHLKLEANRHHRIAYQTRAKLGLNVFDF